MDKMRAQAAALIRHYAYDHDPDQRTSMADSRIALCIAQGVAMEDIDPASGYNHSRAGYDHSRQSWVSNIEQHGFCEFYDRLHIDRAIANWTASRPDFIAGDDWVAAGFSAHRAYWADKGRTCNRETCDICHTGQPA